VTLRAQLAVVLLCAATSGMVGFALGRASMQAETAPQPDPGVAEQTPSGAESAARPDSTDATEVANHLLNTAPRGEPVSGMARRHVGTWSTREPYEPPPDPELVSRAMPPRGTRVPLERITRLTLTVDGGARLLRYIARKGSLGQAASRDAMGFATELRGGWATADEGLVRLELQGAVNPWVEGMPIFKARHTGQLARMERVPKKGVHALLLVAQGEPTAGAAGRRTLSIEFVSIQGGDLLRESLDLEREAGE